MKSFLLTSLLFLSVLIDVSAQSPAQSIPEFTFYKFDKSAFTKKQVEPGKPSLFVFFDATCIHCQNTMKLFASRYPDLVSTAVYLVSLDTKDAINTFINTYGKGLAGKKNVTILQDLKYEFIPKFRPDKYPSVFLFNSSKKLLFYTSQEKEVPKVFSVLKAQKKSAVK